MELSKKRQTKIDDALNRAVVAAFGATDLEKQLDATINFHERLEEEYENLLADHAPNKFSCYIEYMTPDEPPAEHHEFMCDNLEALECHDLMRLCFSCPPGHAKTKYFSRMFPAWTLGRNPYWRFLQGGHSQSFAENEFGKPVRDLISDPKHTRIFPECAPNPRSTAAGNWRLRNGRGGYVTKGVGQKIAGYRGNIGGGDDLIGSKEDARSPLIRERVWNWLWADFRTRFLPGSPIFLVATRWDNDDPFGRIADLNRKGRGIPWEIINLNALIENEYEMAIDPLGRGIGEALWPDYYTVDELLELKSTLPTEDWLALYKGTPRNAETQAVKSGWFGRYRELPRNLIDPNGNILSRRIKRVTVSVDCAQKIKQRSSYSVATVWIETIDNYDYLADVVRRKVEYNDLVDLINDTAALWEADTILVEDKGHGTAYIQQWQGKAPAPVVAIQPEAEGSKEFRFDAITPELATGRVLLPVSAPWLTDYEDELLAFPTGVYMDQIDSTSQYFTWKKKGRHRGGTRKLRGMRHSK